MVGGLGFLLGASVPRPAVEALKSACAVVRIPVQPMEESPAAEWEDKPGVVEPKSVHVSMRIRLP